MSELSQNPLLLGYNMLRSPNNPCIFILASSYLHLCNAQLFLARYCSLQRIQFCFTFTISNISSHVTQTISNSDCNVSFCRIALTLNWICQERKVELIIKAIIILASPPFCKCATKTVISFGSVTALLCKTCPELNNA